MARAERTTTPTRRGGVVAAAVAGAIAITMSAALVAPAVTYAGEQELAPFSDFADVGVVAPSPDDAGLIQAVARIRLELQAAGLPSHLVDCTQPDALATEACIWARSAKVAASAPGPASDPAETGVTAEARAAQPGPLPGARRATAVLSLSRRARAVMVEAMATLPSGTKVFRLVHVKAPGEGGEPGLLAIRAAELLRDVRLEVVRSAREEDLQRRQVEERARVARTSPVTIDAAAEAPVDVLSSSDDEDDASKDPGERTGSWRTRFSGWAVSAGAMVLQGRRGFGTSIAPTVGLLVPMPRHASLSFELMLAGPFFRSLDTTGNGSVATQQEFGAVGGRWGRSSGRLRPFAAATIGLHHVRVTGLVSGADHSSTATVWSPALAASGGLAVPLGRLLRATAEVGALFTTPATSIITSSEVIGSTGDPSFLYQVSLAAVLP